MTSLINCIALPLRLKGQAGNTAWPVDNVTVASQRHFIAFVCFHGQITDPQVVPEVWIIPSTELKPFVYFAPGGRRVVQRSKLKEQAGTFRNAWSLIT